MLVKVNEIPSCSPVQANLYFLSALHTHHFQIHFNADYNAQGLSLQPVSIWCYLPVQASLSLLISSLWHYHHLTAEERAHEEKAMIPAV